MILFFMKLHFFYLVGLLFSTFTEVHLFTASIKKQEGCWNEAKCEPLENEFCFGTKLTYSHTSLSLTNLTSQNEAREKLEKLADLKNLPQCWSVVQPFICAVLFPECSNGSVQLPAQEMCTVTRLPCELAIEQTNWWADYLKCRKEFPDKSLNCKITSQNLNFDTSSQCLHPLIETTDMQHWYPGIPGCGLKCFNSFLEPTEQLESRNNIKVYSLIALIFSIICMSTIGIKWRAASKCPDVFQFYQSLCFFIISICFLTVSSDTNAWDNVLCHEDGTLNTGESFEENSWSCTFVFLFICPLFYSSEWLKIFFAYSCSLIATSSASGNCERTLTKNRKYFHFGLVVIFGLALIFQFIFHIVKPDPALGICFLSDSPLIGGVAVLLPSSISFFAILGFYIAALIRFVKLKLENSNTRCSYTNRRLKWIIFRLLISCLIEVVKLVLIYWYYINTFLYQFGWAESFNEYIICNLTDEGCENYNYPSSALYKMKALFLLIGVLDNFFWCCSSDSVDNWKTFFKRVLDVENKDSVKLTKHKVIRHVYAKKKDLNTIGRLSISLGSLHSSPIGLNVGSNCAAPESISSTWVAALPSLMNRRSAVVGGLPKMTFNKPNYETDSNCSSISGSQSMDSQMSFRVSDIERTVAMNTLGKYRKKRKPSLRDFMRKKKNRKSRKRLMGRRESNTSNDSSFSFASMVLPTFSNIMELLNRNGDEGPGGRSKNKISVDSEDENNSMAASLEFSRKYNGFMKRRLSITADRRTFPLQQCPPVVKASIGVQTSLESLNRFEPTTAEKCCQVNTPLLKRAAETCLSSSFSGSSTSLSESKEAIGGTRFANNLKTRISPEKKNICPVSQSLGESQDKIIHCKKRSFSESNTSGS